MSEQGYSDAEVGLAPPSSSDQGFSDADVGLSEKPSEPSLWTHPWNLVPKAIAAARGSDTAFGPAKYDPSIPETSTLGAASPGTATDMGSPEQMMRMAHMTTNDPEALANIALKQFPDATRGADRWGNPTVDIKGKTYYLNRPGLSLSDVTTGIGTAIPLGAAAALTDGLSIPFATPIMSAAGAVTSAASDIVSNLFGSKQGVDLPKAAETGLLTGGFTMLAPVFSDIWRSLTPSRVMIDPKTGMPTPRGTLALESAGIPSDPSKLTPQFITKFNELGANALEPDQAARAAQAASLPVPVPQTTRMITQNPADQSAEDAMAASKQEGTRLLGQKVLGQRALYQNTQAVGNSLAGGGPVIDVPGGGSREVQTYLSGQEQAANAAGDAAYDTARAAGGQIKPQGVPTLINSVESPFLANHTSQTAPLAQSFIDDLKNITGADQPGGAVNPANIRQLFEWRQKVSDFARDTNNGVEASAASKLIRGSPNTGGGFDDFMNQALAKDLATGDPNAIKAWQDAMKQWKDYRTAFSGKDVIQSLTKMEMRSGEMQLAVPPDQAVNTIFGTGQVLGGGRNYTRDILLLKDRLPAEQWNLLKQDAWGRIISTAGKQMAADGAGFNGTALASSINDALRSHPEAMNALFSGDEINVMRQLQRTASQTTRPVAAGYNASRTATIAWDRMKEMAKHLYGVDFLMNMHAASEATGAMNPTLALRGTVPPSVGGAIGGAAGAGAIPQSQQ